MNKEEIENIIRRVRVTMYNHAKGFFDYDDVVDYGLNYNEWKQLLDYIEKLTQENNDLEQLLSKQYCDGLRQGKFDNEMKVLELQSVINELEKWLKEMLDSENDIFSVIRVKDVLDKLNELRSKK